MSHCYPSDIDREQFNKIKPLLESARKNWINSELNGEIRPIVVKKGDKMVARSLLRLLIDSKNKTPVLLLERLYSNVATTAVEKDILDWAINKARKMGIPLISNEIGKGSRYDGNVEFMGGSAPFVYSDASGGVLSEHFYTEGCHRLYP